MAVGNRFVSGQAIEVEDLFQYKNSIVKILRLIEGGFFRVPMIHPICRPWVT